MLAVSAVVIAAQDEHKGHDGHSVQQKSAEHGEHDGPHYGVTPSAKNNKQLQKLESMQPSGRSREATSDGRYNMEPTTVENDLATQCALGSRGIVMLDNATWKKCGGKPKGAAKGAGYYPAIPPWNKEGRGKTSDVDHSMH